MTKVLEAEQWAEFNDPSRSALPSDDDADESPKMKKLLSLLHVVACKALSSEKAVLQDPSLWKRLCEFVVPSASVNHGRGDLSEIKKLVLAKLLAPIPGQKTSKATKGGRNQERKSQYQIRRDEDKEFDKEYAMSHRLPLAAICSQFLRGQKGGDKNIHPKSKTPFFTHQQVIQLQRLILKEFETSYHPEFSIEKEAL